MNPEELMMMQQQQPQPIDIQQVIQAYMQQALTIQADQMLNLDKKTQAMLQMAQGLAALVPLATNDKEMELQLKAQEHQMDMQMKQAELQMKAEEHRMKLEQSNQSHNLKLHQTEQSFQQKSEQSKNVRVSQ
jgi:hypothetical protein